MAVELKCFFREIKCGVATVALSFADDDHDYRRRRLEIFQKRNATLNGIQITATHRRSGIGFVGHF